MCRDPEEILEYVKENDVKFIRLAFCDIFGVQKNIAIQPSELPRAFSQGISFDASAISGFMNVEESDLFLLPDPSTLCVLPWRPDHGRVVRLFCHIRYPDGRPFEGDCRRLLRDTAERAARRGYLCRLGAECEFYLFQRDEGGAPTSQPLDQAGYFDIYPLDRGENLRRDVCLALEQMGFAPQASHHEQGPGQNEVIFQHSTAVRAADNVVTFKAAVRSIAAQHGLHASFMPKPLPGAPGSGMHINMSLYDRQDANLFLNKGDGLLPQAKQFIAGILHHAAGLCAFLNPTVNSYSRLGSFEAPSYLTWSPQNRSQLVRIPAAEGDFSRMELRSPDAACNPYLGFALLIEAGMEGIEQGLALPEPVNCDLYQPGVARRLGLRQLPGSLEEALALAEESPLVRRVLPESTRRKYLALKRQEAQEARQAADRAGWERAQYFEQL